MRWPGSTFSARPARARRRWAPPSLPVFGIPFPSLGAVGLTLLGALAIWTVVHFGYSLITPGAFSGDILRLLPDGVALLRLDGRIRSANARPITSVEPPAAYGQIMVIGRVG